jgi:hypothetical protein
MDFSLSDYESIEGGNPAMEKLGDFYKNNAGWILGLMIVLTLLSIYAIYSWWNKKPESFSPTHMAPYILRDGIGESFDVSQCPAELKDLIHTSPPDTILSPNGKGFIRPHHDTRQTSHLTDHHFAKIMSGDRI